MPGSRSASHAAEMIPAGIRAGQKVNPDLLFRLFLRSKSLVQDSTLEPKYNVFRACPAAENLPILPPFLFPEGAVLTHAEEMPVPGTRHQPNTTASRTKWRKCRT